MQGALTDGAVDDGEDRLFDTLDTVLRRLWLPSGRQIVVSDTVGFISDLPTQLLDAFKAWHRHGTSAPTAGIGCACNPLSSYHSVDEHLSVFKPQHWLFRAGGRSA